MDIEKLGPPSEKKLKWGLHDLSPLFQPVSPPTPEASSPRPVAFEVQFLTVCVPDQEGDAFLVNAYVASQWVRETKAFASLIAITPGMNLFASRGDPLSLPPAELLHPQMVRLSLSHQEIWSLTRKGFEEHPSRPPLPSQLLPPCAIFLEFEPSQFHSLAQVALLLDRLVLFVSPGVENLKEAYRLMKVFWSLNREIEFFLLFRGEETSPPHEGFLFERFSLIASRFLGVNTEWLGNLAFPEKKSPLGRASPPGVRFHLDPLLEAEGLKRPLSPEKYRFWHYLQRRLESRLRHESS